MTINFWLILNICPDDMPAFVKLMRNTAARAPSSKTEFRIKNSAEQYYWCMIRATAQFDFNRRPVKAVGVIVDINNEKTKASAS